MSKLSHEEATRIVSRAIASGISMEQVLCDIYKRAEKKHARRQYTYKVMHVKQNSDIIALNTSLQDDGWSVVSSSYGYFDGENVCHYVLRKPKDE